MTGPVNDKLATASAAGSSDSTKDPRTYRLDDALRMANEPSSVELQNIELRARAVAAEAQLAETEERALTAEAARASAESAAELRLAQAKAAHQRADGLRVTLDKIREWCQGVIDHCSAERIDPPAWCASLAALLGEGRQG